MDQGAASRTKGLFFAGPMAVSPIDCHFLDFRDHWGNRSENVGYDNIEFTKAPLRGMELTHLTKNESAKKSWQKRTWRLSGIDYPSKIDTNIRRPPLEGA